MPQASPGPRHVTRGPSDPARRAKGDPNVGELHHRASRPIKDE